MIIKNITAPVDLGPIALAFLAELAVVAKPARAICLWSGDHLRSNIVRVVPRNPSGGYRDAARRILEDTRNCRRKQVVFNLTVIDIGLRNESDRSLAFTFAIRNPHPH